MRWFRRIVASTHATYYAQSVVEHLAYQVSENLPGGIEIRSYPEHQTVSVDVRAGVVDAGSVGFGPLVSYISGHNAAAQSISMTAPVLQFPETDHDTVSFVLPRRVDHGSWPSPTDSRLRLETKPPSLVAALRFRGYWTENVFRDAERRLLTGLDDSLYRPSGQPYFARYNPPGVPGFLRRNEVLVRVSPDTTAEPDRNG